MFRCAEGVTWNLVLATETEGETMYVPTWVFWAGGILFWLGLTAYAGRNRGDYDFVSPLLGAAVFFIGLAFVIGYLIGG